MCIRDRSRNRPVDEDICAFNGPISYKSARGRYCASVRPDLKNSFVILCSLLIAHLAKLGNRPSHSRRVPRTKIPDVAPLATPESLSILDGNTPPVSYTHL